MPIYFAAASNTVGPVRNMLIQVYNMYCQRDIIHPGQIYIIPIRRFVRDNITLEQFIKCLHHRPQAQPDIQIALPVNSLHIRQPAHIGAPALVIVTHPFNMSSLPHITHQFSTFIIPNGPAFGFISGSRRFIVESLHNQERQWLSYGAFLHSAAPFHPPGVRPAYMTPQPDRVNPYFIKSLLRIIIHPRLVYIIPMPHNVCVIIEVDNYIDVMQHILQQAAIACLRSFVFIPVPGAAI